LTSFSEIEGATVETGVRFSRLTSWRVGGPAKYLINVQRETALAETLSLVKELDLPLLLLGNGTNILASDRGFNGVVLRLSGYFARSLVDGTRLTTGSGASLSAAVRVAFEESLSGLEFALGIPGTVGGAVMMNAGAFGWTTAQVLESVETMTLGEEQRIYESFEDTYRTALVPADEIVTAAVFKLKEVPYPKIQKQMDKIKNQRRDAQPAGHATAGSVFKNPAGDYAGRLIEACGMKGVAVGAARVSMTHANFIVNEGGATAADMKDLIDKISDEVRYRFGIVLETEVKLVGFEEE
jgi:UDP-N-acetylmuramate dehydrogenase